MNVRSGIFAILKQSLWEGNAKSENAYNTYGTILEYRRARGTEAIQKPSIRLQQHPKVGALSLSLAPERGQRGIEMEKDYIERFQPRDTDELQKPGLTTCPRKGGESRISNESLPIRLENGFVTS